ncbi:MAG: NUDIX domain-containing protein [Deltaproteobacteria bacterium]|nr:NUDIX domain-containing protein [Deltaproteobacteria bacterium]
MPLSEYLRNLRRHVGKELLLMPSVTAIVFDERERVLLARHGDTGQWVAPGGSIEPHETPANAVVREAFEETGLLVEPTQILGVFGGPEFEVVYANGDRVTYVMTVFECQVLSGTLAPDKTETLELQYIGATEFDRVNLAPWAKVVLPEICRRKGQPYFAPATWYPK